MVRVPYDVTTGGSGSRRWGGNTDLPPQPKPTEEALRTARSALKRSRQRMAYLTDRRGLTRATIREYGLGFDGGYLFPVRGEEGDLLTVVKHCPWFESGHGRYDVPRGSRAAMYPSLPPSRACILTAGMFDALIGRQYGLPTVTTTCGFTLPGELAAQFAGKRVAVVFDVGEEHQAEDAVSRLPTEAWAVNLPLPEGDDVADWFVKHRRSRKQLLRLVREARP